MKNLKTLLCLVMALTLMLALLLLLKAAATL